jgi:hypothetical protein
LFFSNPETARRGHEEERSSLAVFRNHNEISVSRIPRRCCRTDHDGGGCCYVRCGTLKEASMITGSAWASVALGCQYLPTFREGVPAFGIEYRN